MLRHPFLIYTLKFLGIFCLLYYGTEAVIGMSAPGGYYSSFVEHYLNYPALLRYSLLYGAKFLLALSGASSYVHDINFLRLQAGPGVRIVYSCLGVGVMSCWVAFVLANEGGLKSKITWCLAGVVLIWLINVCRMALVLTAAAYHWKTPFQMEHHTLFNIVAYAAIFVIGFFFDRSRKRAMHLS